MDKIANLKAQFAEASRKANAMIENKGSSVWNKDEQSEFDGHVAVMESIKAQIKSIEALRNADADKFFDSFADSKKDDKNVDVRDVVAMYLRRGSNVSAEEAIQIKNAMSTGTNTEGGYTVPHEIASTVVDALKDYGGMREASTIISTANGATMSWPTSDGTAEVGAIVGENVGASTGDITFGSVDLSVYKYTSGKIALPIELVEDSGIDIVTFVINRLATRIARIQNAHFTNGTGSTQPIGVVTSATSGATADAISYDALADLKYSVNRAYRQRDAVFMMSDAQLATVIKLKDLDGRPIWQPSITAGQPDMLLGHRVITNDDVASGTILFGDFSKYTIRDVASSTQIRRFDDSGFAINGQVGFCGWQRSGGALLDTAAVKKLVIGG